MLGPGGHIDLKYTGAVNLIQEKEQKFETAFLYLGKRDISVLNLKKKANDDNFLKADFEAISLSFLYGMWIAISCSSTH